MPKQKHLITTARRKTVAPAPRKRLNPLDSSSSASSSDSEPDVTVTGHSGASALLAPPAGMTLASGTVDGPPDSLLPSSKSPEPSEKFTDPVMSPVVPTTSATGVSNTPVETPPPPTGQGPESAPASSSSSSSSSSIVIASMADIIGQVLDSNHYSGAPKASASSKRPADLPPLPPLLSARPWTSCNLPERVVEDEEYYSFGVPEPVRDRPAVLHPGVFDQLTVHRDQLKKPLRKALEQSLQAELLEVDFIEALDRWDPQMYCLAGAMWASLEASRYCTLNPRFEAAWVDVNVAVKLLVPETDSDSWQLTSRNCFRIEAVSATINGSTSTHCFQLLPPLSQAGLPPGSVDVRASKSLACLVPVPQERGPNPPAGFQPPQPAQPLSTAAFKSPLSGSATAAVYSGNASGNSNTAGATNSNTAGAKNSSTANAHKANESKTDNGHGAKAHQRPGGGVVSKRANSAANTATTLPGCSTAWGDCLVQRRPERRKLPLRIPEKESEQEKETRQQESKYWMSVQQKTLMGRGTFPSEEARQQWRAKYPEDPSLLEYTVALTTELVREGEEAIGRAAERARATYDESVAARATASKARAATIDTQQPRAPNPAHTTEGPKGLSDQDLARQMALIRDEIKRRKSGTSESISSSSDSEEERKEEDWSANRMNEVKDLIVAVHAAQRGSAHSDAYSGEWSHDQQKYNILIKHLRTSYEVKEKGKNNKETKTQVLGSKLLPPSTDQKDNLMALVISACPGCHKLRKSRDAQEKEKAAVEEQKKRDWATRINHRYVELEYESDNGHQADPFCFACKLKSGRKAHMRKRFDDDKDELFNCEGCTKAFHYSCGGLIQDTADARRRYGLEGHRGLTFARRVEPHLCEECWRHAGARQLAFDRKKFEDERDKARAKHEERRAKRARGSSSNGSSVNTQHYAGEHALGHARELCSGPSAGESEDDGDEEMFLQYTSFRECLEELAELVKLEQKSGSKKPNSQPMPPLQFKRAGNSSEIEPKPGSNFQDKLRENTEKNLPNVKISETPPALGHQFSHTRDVENFGAPPRIRSNDRSELVQQNEQFGNPVEGHSSLGKEQDDAYTADAFVAEIMKIVGCTKWEAEDKFFSSLAGTPTPISAMAYAISTLTQEKFKSPIDCLRETYEGHLMSSETQQPDLETSHYRKIRQFVVNLINDESCTDDVNQTQRLLNIALETTTNFHQSCLEVAERYDVPITIVDEHVRNLTVCSNGGEWTTFWKSCQAGFLKSRTESRRKIQEFLLEAVPGSKGQAAIFSKELKLHGNFAKALEETIRVLKSPKLEEPASTNSTDANPDSAVPNEENTLLRMINPTIQSEIRRQVEELVAHGTIERHLTNPSARTYYSPVKGGNGTFEESRNDGSWQSQKSTTSIRVPLPEDAGLKEIYQRALLDESQNADVKYSLQLDRPIQWEATSTDPKYPCVGYVQTAYIFWRNHCQKRRAQGAPQKYITFISFDIVSMIVSTLRIVPASKIISMSDEELLDRLDKKFQIAQESNLLMKKFAVPKRPTKLASYELHIPQDEFHIYATEWLAELRVNQARHKDLDKYNLSDVFIQSLHNCRMLYDHARVLSKLSVEDLIASCSEFMGEQVVNERRTEIARRQLATTPMEVEPNSANEQQTRSKQDNQTISKNTFVPRNSKVFFTAGTKPPGQQEKKANFTATLKYLVAFVKLPFFDVSCEGCGKSYKANPGRTFPYPCHGACQYTGHPSMNTRYQEGSKWKHSGLCCSWKGMEDSEIPPQILARLKKYSDIRKKAKEEP